MIEWAMNPLSRRLRIGLILLDEVKDVVVCPTDSGWNALELWYILYARLQLFIKAKDLQTENLPGYKDMEQFCQILGIKTKQYPGAVTIVAQMIIQGRDRATEPDRQEWQIDDDFSDTISNDDQKEFISMVRRLSIGSAFSSTNQRWVGIGPTAITTKDIVVRIWVYLRYVY